MASVADRNARIAALVSAAQAWGTQRTQALNDQVTLLTNLLSGRNSANNLAQAGFDAAKNAVVAQIDDFLTP